jgi:hypothetical protein
MLDSTYVLLPPLLLPLLLAGECYVELADRDAQSAAMMRHKELMGSRYIEIFHSSKMDKLQAQQARLCMPPPTLGRCELAQAVEICFVCCSSRHVHGTAAWLLERSCIASG